MPFQPIADTMKVLVQAQRDGQLMENVWYVRASGGVDATALGTVADAFATWASSAAYRSQLPTNVTLTSIKAITQNDDSGLQVEVPLSGITGTQAGQPLANSVSLAIHKAAGIGGRHGKARVYHFGLSQDVMASPNTVLAAATNDICNAYRALRDAIDALGIGAFELGYAVLVEAGLPLPVGLFVEIIDFICKDNIVDNQRRRLPGRGR